MVRGCAAPPPRPNTGPTCTASSLTPLPQARRPCQREGTTLRKGVGDELPHDHQCCRGWRGPAVGRGHVRYYRAPRPPRHAVRTDCRGDRPGCRAALRDIVGRRPAQHQAGQDRADVVADDPAGPGAAAVVANRHRNERRGVRLAGRGAQLREPRCGAAATGLRPGLCRPDRPVRAMGRRHAPPWGEAMGSGPVRGRRRRHSRRSWIPRHRAAVGRPTRTSASAPCCRWS